MTLVSSTALMELNVLTPDKISNMTYHVECSNYLNC